jgi:prepilin-type N-terminal cleavage/methylation domain-containing protein
MNKKAFTLVEMAIVLVIIGILAGLTISNLAGFGKKGRDQRRATDLLRLSADLITYFNAKGSFPTPKSDYTLPDTFTNYKDPISGWNYYYSTSSLANEVYLGACFEAGLYPFDPSVAIECSSTPMASGTNAVNCSSGSTFTCIRVRP